jgi:hypothetical protein
MSHAATRPPKHRRRGSCTRAWRVHRALYRLSGGRFLWTTSNKRGWGSLRLTTVGRKSGQERSVIIGYLEDGPKPHRARDERLGRPGVVGEHTRTRHGW